MVIHQKSIFILSGLLLFILAFGPSLAFAAKLPTVCNIFLDKPIHKGGHCGEWAAIFLPDNSADGFPLFPILFENQIFYSSGGGCFSSRLHTYRNLQSPFSQSPLLICPYLPYGSFRFIQISRIILSPFCFPDGIRNGIQKSEIL